MIDRQLPLAFPHTPGLTAADFLPHPGTRMPLEFLGATATWPEGRLLLWGGPGEGKTHLLHLWAQECGAMVIAGSMLREPFWPEGPVALDDADDAPSEPALLHLLNAAAEADRPMLLTASRPPSRIGFRLPDLASRMRATTAIEIGPPDDAFLAALFARLLAERQLAVAPATQAWLLARLPRTPASIDEAAARLDYAALAGKCSVTERLARAALRDLLSPEPATEISA